MADGVSSGGGGFGETIFDATKNAFGTQFKKTVAAAGAQLTGQPLGNAQSTNPSSGTFNPQAPAPKKNPFAGSMPPNMGDFGKLFEKNQLGQKQPMKQAPTTNNKTQQELEEMSNVQQAKDAQEIARLTQELHQLYAKKVMSSGEEALKKEREYLEKQREDDEQNSLRRKEIKQSENATIGPIGKMQSGTLTPPGPTVTQADRSGESGKHTG